MKTQKSFKKKALLSSLAMLMVAVVALSSATFAWFTSNTTSSAAGINVRTTKVSNLQISKWTHTWTDIVDYGLGDSGKILKPISTSDGVEWYSAKAESQNSYKKADSENFSSESNLSNYVFMDQLNVKNNGGAAVKNVTITFKLHDDAASDYLRIALVPAREDVVESTHVSSFAEGVDFKDYVYDTDGVAYETAPALEKITPKTKWQVNIGDLAAKDDGVDAKFYNLYVWFEGQDVDCKDANAGQVVPDITFTITGDTGSELV